jgi:RNA recognition motif-containing protein
MNPARLYVGNLPYNITNELLGQKFAAAGQVISATVVIDKFSGRSRGFGFVEMSSEEEAKKAIEMFNNQNFGEGDMARALVVNIARPPKQDQGNRS